MKFIIHCTAVAIWPLLLLLASTARADEVPSAEAPPADASLHVQATFVEQGHGAFHSPFQGGNSLSPQADAKETFDLTVFAGFRPWRGGELFINPEIDQGFGLDNTLGVAGFPSGEAYKVGRHAPYGRIHRAFLRQTIDLGGAVESVADDVNQIAGQRTHDHLVLTIGKFAVTDVFDNNTYAHDPRGDFLNWSLIDAGAFDYAADAWGFSVGASAEWTHGDWTLRGGLFNLSKIPNSTVLETNFSQYEAVTELERRYQFGGHGGVVRLLGFVNQGRMGSYDDALALGRALHQTPDTALVRRLASRAGGAINIEQQLGANVGAFVRLSGNDGSKEAFEFTEINRSLAGGVVWQGAAWGRAADRFGVAAAINALSSSARAYFAAGGLGILIGDGQLPRYGRERVAEAYYQWTLSHSLALTVDGQYIVNPAYDRERGPVGLLAVRLHAAF
ncbi:MAG: carbohydrate porin [Proteobacteria bacterium]|nr:carbohydrate porin [Pseudomonadota bacterium]